jgi:hypothetical protein
MCFAAKGRLWGRAAKLLLVRRKSWCNEGVSQFALQLTARQYGEVVLPDASTGQVLITLARKLSRCKEGMARVFAIQVQILLSITRVAVQS